MSRTVTPGSIETQRSSHRIATLTPLRMTYVSLPSNSTVYSGSVICVAALLLIAPLLGSSANCNRRLRLKLPWLVWAYCAPNKREHGGAERCGVLLAVISIIAL